MGCDGLELNDEDHVELGEVGAAAAVAIPGVSLMSDDEFLDVHEHSHHEDEARGPDADMVLSAGQLSIWQRRCHFTPSGQGRHVAPVGIVRSRGNRSRGNARSHPGLATAVFTPGASNAGLRARDFPDSPHRERSPPVFRGHASLVP
jgi:hypothetical protein